MPAAIEALRAGFRALAAGRTLLPPRVVVELPGGAATTLVMPAWASGLEAAERGGAHPAAGTGTALTVKVVSLFDGNPARGLARLQGVVLALEPDTGRVAALLDGAALTALRTGAVSGLATELLARPDARVVAIFGAGVQARTQLAAVRCVRAIELVRIFAPTAAHAERMAAELAAGPGPLDARVARTPAEALADADVVCTATSSATPVFADADLRPGTHVNAVGAYRPETAEIPPATVARAIVVVDERHAALSEAGDLLQPIAAGLLTAEHVAAELGELCAGAPSPRTSAADVTLFESVGVAIQDTAATFAALARAEREGIGRVVAL